MSRKYIAPNALAPIADKGGRVTPEWQRYLGGIQDVSGRVAVPVDDLAGAATLADVIAKVNELLAAMRAANQQETAP